MVWGVLSCADRESSASRPLRISVATEPSTVDPARASTVFEAYIINNLWIGLTRYDQGLEVAAGVAQMWSFNADATEITFRLREDARWSDGEPVTSYDFAYAWRRLLDPETAAEYAYFLYDIVNAEAINSGEMTPDELGVETPDEHTLVVHLRRPVVYFPHLTTFMVTMPVRQDLVERYGERWTRPENLVTNGAYTLSEWRHDYRLTLSASPHPLDEAPAIESIEVYTINSSSTALALYQSGHLDVVL
ncbi:MAG: peptide ABC transporter substrate-binding protein, partial [Myxococcales bacterium]|nr:peptide ABC transporter substrate-binding protein [Myxococcales bacterium]